MLTPDGRGSVCGSMRTLLVSLVVLLAAAAGLGATREYREERSTGAVRMSIRELGALITAIESQLEEGEHGVLTVGTEQRDIRVSGDYGHEVLSDAPDPSTQLTYYYGPSDGPVTNVWINYDRLNSRFVVEGSDRGRVQSLANDIEARLEAHSTLIGTWIVFAFLIAAVLLGGVLAVHKPGWKPVLLVLAAFLLPASFWAGMRSSSWFPVIVVRHTERNFDLIGVIGIVLGIAALVAPFIVKRRRRGTPTENSGQDSSSNQTVRE